MPDTPESTGPRRGRGGILRGRGRGTAPAAGALPGGRLSSLRGTPSAPSSTGKMQFTPNIPARRKKREPGTAPPSTATPIKPPVDDKKKKVPQRRERRRVELRERIVGPFSEGPALAGRSGGSQFAGTSYGAGGKPMGVAKTEVGAVADGAADGSGELGHPGDVQVTDYNQRALDGGGLEVQTEEMALAAFEQMRRLQLDYGVAEAFGQAGAASDLDLEDGRLLVFQIPKVPDFALDEAVRQRQQMARLSAQDDGPAAMEDVKPTAVDLAIDVDAAAAANTTAAATKDIKPDIAKLEAAAIDNKDRKDTKNVVKVDITNDTDEEEEDVLDGRVGTLVVLRSGAVRLRMGRVLFDVSRGADCQFLRGLLAVDVRGDDEGGSTARLLGNVATQLQCTPDLDSIV
ncbi:DNA-directed RNA polymerase III subunit RPC4 [Coemansia sp. RSA 552]|nr:DNA-directed RNA polymerase III subunit RPC4 [Coemansia sp. RSA 552]KAJ2162801.1 DNA-directed RNA polymerase III subunit RPC4 [Coemansia sp. RSA 552]